MIYVKHNFRDDVVAFNPNKGEALQAGANDINITEDDENGFKEWATKSGFISCTREEFERVYKKEISRVNEFIKEVQDDV